MDEATREAVGWLTAIAAMHTVAIVALWVLMTLRK